MPTFVRLLGRPGVQYEGAWHELPTGLPSALLYYLTYQSSWVSREKLAFLFWPDMPETNARRNLRNLILRVRALPYAQSLEAERNRIRWQVETDVESFKQAITANDLSNAIGFYGGELLQGFQLDDALEFTEWLETERQALHEQWREVVLKLAHTHEAEGAHDKAADILSHLGEADPLDEDILQRQLNQLHLSGQKAKALNLFESFREKLEQEYGGEPDEATLVLVESIRTSTVTSHANSLASKPKFEPPAGVDNAVPLFVARQRELGVLEQHLDTALTGQHQTIFVMGEAGQGKTALSQAFARQTQSQHPTLLVATGNCNAYTGIGDPYLPFREILELLTGDVEARSAAGTLHLDNARRLWDNLATGLTTVLEEGPELVGSFLSSQSLLQRAEQVSFQAPFRKLIERQMQGGGSGVQQSALFEQYAKVIQSLSRHTPLLLLLDDLQWVDEGSVTLLLHLSKRLKGYPVLMLGAFRPAEVALGRGDQRHPLEQVINELKRDMGDIVLDLGQAEGRGLIDDLLDSEPNSLGEAFRDTLYQLTKGHPLFTGELLSGMQERGDVKKDEQGIWYVQDTLDWDTLPARVEGAIGERIGRLAPDLKDMLQAASIEGEEFTAEVVAEVTGTELKAMTRQLSQELDKKHQLVRALGIRREANTRITRYRFKHILIQHYLYSQLDEVERVYQHEALGNALENLYQDQTETVAVQLARHFELAEMPDKAAIYLGKAGDQAKRAVALDEAVRYYRAALETWSEDDKPGRAQLLKSLGETLWMLGQLEDARATFQEAAHLFDALGDVQNTASVQRHIGRLYWELGEREKSLEHYHLALNQLEAGPETTELAWAISSISQMHMLANEEDKAIRWGERALAIAERLGAEDVRIHALANVGTSLMHKDELTRGQAMLMESSNRARELGMPHDACRALANLCDGLTRRGFYEEIQPVFDQFLSYAKHKQLPLFLGGGTVLQSQMYWQTGNWQEVMEGLDNAIFQNYTTHTIAYVKITAGTFLGHVYNDLGQPEKAHAILAEIKSNVQNHDEWQLTVPYLAEAGLAHNALGLLDKTDTVAVLLAVPTEALGASHSFRALLLIVETLISKGAVEQARAFIDQFQEVPLEENPILSATIQEMNGVTALSTADMKQAVQHLQQASEQWQQLGHPLDEARTLNALAQASTKLDKKADARAALEKANELINALAEQLEGTDFRNSFLDTPLVKSIQGALASADLSNGAPLVPKLE